MHLLDVQQRHRRDQLRTDVAALLYPGAASSYCQVAFTVFQILQLLLVYCRAGPDGYAQPRILILSLLHFASLARAQWAYVFLRAAHHTDLAVSH